MSERPSPRPPSLGHALLAVLFAAPLGAAAAVPWFTDGEFPVWFGGIFLPMALLCTVSAIVGLGAATLGIPLDDDEQQRVATQFDGARAIGRISPGRRAVVAGCFLVGAAVIFYDLFEPGRLVARLLSFDVLFGAPFGLLYLTIAVVLVLPGAQRQALLAALRRLESKRQG